MKFILFFFFLFAIYNNARLMALKKYPTIAANTFNFAGTDVNSAATNNGIGAATSVALGLATNVNVNTQVQTNVGAPHIAIGRLI